MTFQKHILVVDDDLVVANTRRQSVAARIGAPRE
jgi:hypothetical protein